MAITYTLVLALLFHVVPQPVVATDSENLYSKALFASIREMEKSWGRIDTTNGGGSVQTDYKHMVVEKDPAITDGLPEQSDDYRVEYLDRQGLVERYKSLRKEFPVLKIHPMKNEGAKLKIAVSVYWASYKHGKLLLGLSDWSEVQFTYDCAKQSFVVSAVKLGGV